MEPAHRAGRELVRCVEVQPRVDRARPDADHERRRDHEPEAWRDDIDEKTKRDEPGADAQHAADAELLHHDAADGARREIAGGAGDEQVAQLADGAAKVLPDDRPRDTLDGIR